MINTTSIRRLAGTILTLALAASPMASTHAQDAPRARDLGVVFQGETGPLNAITDVAGIEVGHETVIEGDNVRTGVTAIFPLGSEDPRAVRAGFATINGTGEVTGSHLIGEAGLFFGPIMLTGTWGVGTVRNGYLRWVRDNMPQQLWTLYSLPVIAETSDEGLNDIFGMHLTEDHVRAALDSASEGPVTEGNVGGGTGMQAYGFKGGIGTSSRRVALGEESYTIGVLVQANHGTMENLMVVGQPIGRQYLASQGAGDTRSAEVKNSLIIVIATDLPLRPDQLDRLARRAALGLGRTGATGTNVSGDFAIAFSTASPTSFEEVQSAPFVTMFAFAGMDSIFDATVAAVEEALINQLVASRDMTANGITMRALPHELLSNSGD